MTQEPLKQPTSETPAPTAALNRLLHRAARLLLVTETMRAASLAVAILLGAVLLALLIDAVLALQPTWLIAIDVALIALMLIAVGYLLRQVVRQFFNARHLARVIEQRAGIRDSRLINAIDLAEGTGHSASRVFIERSLQRGEGVAAALSPAAAVDRQPLRKALIVLCVATLAGIVLHLAAPGLISAVGRRLLNPTAMHAPFTLLKFNITVEPDKIYYGRAASIRAAIAGPGVPDRASVVFVDQQPSMSEPMLRTDESTAAEKIFMLPIDRAEQSRSFYIDAPGGRSDVFTLSVLPVPQFEHVAVRYEFPEYTKWPAIDKALGADGVKALVGTEVVFTARSNLPLQSGTIALAANESSTTAQPEIQMHPSPDDPQTIVGRVKINSNGQFAIKLIGRDGTPSDETRSGLVTAVPDALPKIEITQPPQHVVAPEGYPIDALIRAQDDVGVDRIVLSRSINGWGPYAADLEFQRDQPTSAVASATFDLPALGAKAGDVITYFATAYDNHPDPAQFADTPTYVIEVISMEEYEEFARTEYRMEEMMQELQAFERRMENLKAQRDELVEQLEELQQKAEAGEELSAADLERMAQLEKALEEYEQEAAQLAQDMQQRAEQDPLYEFEQSYQDMLKSMAEGLENQAANAQKTAEAMQNAQQQPSPASSSAMAAAAEEFMNESEPFDEQSQQEMEQTEKDMEAMQMADDMVAQAERIRQVILQQRDLADRMAQFRDREDLTPSEQLRAHKFAEDQEQLRQELEDAKQKLEEAAQQAQERLPNMSGQAQKLCDALGEMNVAADQSSAAEQSREGDGRAAHEAAERAAKNLESLLSDCNSDQMQQQASDELDGCLKLPKPGMRQSMRQMAQSRGMPGMDQRNGSGAGFAGSQARMSVMGPRIKSTAQSEADSQMQSGITGRSESGDAVAAFDIDQNPAVQTLDPASASARKTSAAAMIGVPVQFRDQAEAYFRRLAAEGRRKRGD